MGLEKQERVRLEVNLKENPSHTVFFGIGETVWDANSWDAREEMA